MPSPAPTPPLSDEQLRILRAVQRGTLTVSRAGRYIITDEAARPDRRAREQLVSSDHLHYVLLSNRYPLALTARGRAALAPASVAMSADRCSPSGARTWEMWALDGHLPGREPEFAYPSPHRRFIDAYRQDYQRAVRVTVTENPSGRYFGWLTAGDDTPTMIFAHGLAFRMCFAYGPQAEVDAGRGVVLKLDIERSGDDQPVR